MANRFPSIDNDAPATAERVLGAPSRRTAYEILGFWYVHGAIGERQEALRRLGEVLLVMRDPDGAIVAVSSIYPYSLPRPGRIVGMRAFIDPAWRSLPMMAKTFDSIIYAIHDTATEPTTVVVCTDNRKLMGAGNRRWYERRGWTRISADDADRDEWILGVGPGTG